MFRNSVRKGKTNVMEYMLDNGFQLKSPGLRHILHELLLECANGDCKEEHLTLSTILLVRIKHSLELLCSECTFVLGATWL